MAVGVGEVLRCKRQDLLLPSDTFSLEESEPAVYLCMRTSKTAWRGKAHVQRLKVVHKGACKLL